jgi:hypothetical protein
VIQMSISAELLADAMNHTAAAFAGITRAMAEMVERGMFGEWYIIGQVVTVGEVSWVNCHRLHNALYPLPDGWIIVGTAENDGPYTRKAAEEAFGLLMTALEVEDA